MKDWYFVGVDLGQSRDFTAIAVVERGLRTGPWDPVMCAWRKLATLELRYLERLELGTPYPEVVERVVQGKCQANCLLTGVAIGATGSGRPRLRG